MTKSPGRNAGLSGDNFEIPGKTGKNNRPLPEILDVINMSETTLKRRLADRGMKITDFGTAPDNYVR